MIKINNLLVDEKKSILDTMGKLNLAGTRCLFVVDKNKKFKGTLTDGDLRRGMKSFSNNQNLLEIMTQRPLVVNENMPASKALGLMNEKKITSLLVVSDKDYKKNNKKLKGIIHIHSLLENGIK